MATHFVNPGRVASEPDQQPFNLGVHYQEQHRAAFKAALEAGEVKPLVIPWSFVGSFFLPLLYLSIPHVNRPWLYHMRWLVAAAVIYLNVRLLQTTSAINEALGYATGLLASWGTINALKLLIFTRPQWDAARVERRPRSSGASSKEAMEKHKIVVPPDESVGASLAHSEYFWQPFPATGSWLVRLSWTADLITASRGAGWNCSIPSIPHPPFPPRKALENAPVRLDLIPLACRNGTTRSPTYASFLRSRLLEFSLSYLTIDLFTTVIRRDPYFVIGPDYGLRSYPLPALYSRLPFPQFTISVLLRSLPALAGIIAGLHLYYSAIQLIIVFPLRRLFGVRAELWQHPSLFGGFVPSVLDRGLAGFWGGWWHQTFRAGFVAPAEWLLRQHGHSHHRHHADENGDCHHHCHNSQSYTSIRENRTGARLLESFVAFTLSGLVHSAGGYTSVPQTTRFWTPIAFFGLQPVGIILQNTAASFAKHLASAGPGKRATFPCWLCRTANLLFTALWLHFTGWGLIDDMGRAGVWLFEPVPISPFRMMGLGAPGNTQWWRWDSIGYRMGWYTGHGGKWWESGVTL